MTWIGVQPEPRVSNLQAVNEKRVLLYSYGMFTSEALHVITDMQI